MLLEELIVPLKLKMDEFSKQIDGAKSKLSGLNNEFKKNMGSVTNFDSKLGKLAMGGVAAIVGGVTGAIYKSQEWAGTLDELSDKMNTTTKEGAGFALMAKTVDTDISTLTGSMNILAKGLEDTEGNLGPTGLALEKLGISAYDASGNIKPATDLFGEIADKMSTIPEGMEKNALLMDLFGKSGTDLADVLALAANGGMTEFQNKAEDLGLAMSGEALENSIEFKAKMEELNLAVSGVAVTVGTALIPILTPMAEGFAKNVSSLNSLDPALLKVIGTLAGFIVVAVPVLQTITKIGAIIGVVVSGPVMGLIAAFILLGVTILVFGKDAWGSIKMIVELIKTGFGYSATTVLNALKSGFSSIIEPIQAVIGWVQKLIDKLKNLKIPAWLKPGSPPPLYFALKDIQSAMQDLTSGVLPDFSANLAMGDLSSNPVGVNGLEPRNSNNADIIEAIRDSRLDETKLAYALRDIWVRGVG